MMNTLQTPNILIVEDEKIVAWDIQERLESLGYTIAAQATSGPAAILAANQVKPDLVLMDIQLQGEMDGIEAAQIIYQNHNIPVIYLTAHSDDRTLAAAASTSPFGYILKPFQARELHSTIQIALHRHDQESLAHRFQSWLANTLNSLGHATITTDLDGRITFMNPPAEQLTAWSEVDAIGELVTDIVPLISLTDHTPITFGRSATLTHPSLQATDTDGRISLSSACLLRTKTGAGIAVRATATALTTNQGDRIGSVIVLQDITLQQRIELELWHHNQQLEDYQDQLLHQVSAQSTQLAQLSHSSQVLLELLDSQRSMSPQHQRSRNLLAYLGHVLDLDYAWITRHDLAQRTSTVIDEYSPRRQPPPQPPQRPSLLHQSVNLTDSANFYQLLFLGVSWVDPPQTLLPPAYAALMQPQDQVIICPVVAKQGLGQPPVIIGEVGIIATGQSAWNTPLQTKLITQIISCAASLSRQDELEAIGEAQDIDLSMLNYLKADFIGSISHVFKTPLENMKQTINRIETAIHQIEPLAIGTADFRTQQNQIKQKLIHHLEVLETEWRLENDLVNNLLNFQTALTPVAASAMSLIPIDALITEIVELFNLAASRFKQEWCYEILPETLQVFSHRASLQRIIKELLHNAVKYTPPNQQIRISAQLIDHTFELQIISTGITIAADELVQIFHPFYRIPRPNPWDYCGMGMGLALVQKLSLQIGGSITAASSRLGTTFTFTLPQS
jgi:signal transduction histidine kinase/CheY-like chemotaxis protein